MEHTIPQTHLELLQAIWRELVHGNDVDPTFVGTWGVPVPKEEED